MRFACRIVFALGCDRHSRDVAEFARCRGRSGLHGNEYGPRAGQNRCARSAFRRFRLQRRQPFAAAFVARRAGESAQLRRDHFRSGRGWYHWAVADIPAGVTHLPGNASASGALRKLGAVEARNDWGTDGYGGPCPPPGKPHRYVVTVYALGSDDLRLRHGTPALMFEHEIRTVSLASVQLTFTYGR